MSEPAAYFITWSCYGQRLHGDRRGSVNPAHSTFGQAPLDPSSRMEEYARAMLKTEPVVLSAVARSVVDETIRQHCEHRKWRLEAVNVRPTHVHVVVRAPRGKPELIMGQFKSWSTRRLRESGLFLAQPVLWTKHGSTRYLWQESDVPAAVRYVLEMPDEAARYRKAPWES
ncbi:MAG: transposase [Phycisphaeraceae bacterium]|nr:transposase [Phycisphaeraceae bacterium]